jgi:hypothetical protein
MKCERVVDLSESIELAPERGNTKASHKDASKLRVPPYTPRETGQVLDSQGSNAKVRPEF